MIGKYLELDDHIGGGRRVVVAMSGGVDSSVAALLLLRAGFEVVGITMKNFCYGEHIMPDRSCCSLEAIDDARAVCAKLGIGHQVVDVESAFEREVIEDFVSEYRKGRTPNPCIRCNEKVRFSTLVELAGRYGADRIATGHYARIFRSRDGDLFVARGVSAKDQSYFLAHLNRSLLERAIFPLGRLEKREARRLAAEAELPVAEKQESQEVCFIPDGDVRSFLGKRFDFRPGRIVDKEGRELGRHRGLGSFTVGQRRHLGVARARPLYVIRMDFETDTLVVGEEDELMSVELRCTVVWCDKRLLLSAGGDLEAKIRSRHSPARIERVEIDGNDACVRFAEPQKAVTPGQTIAFYMGDLVVGAGKIDGVVSDDKGCD